MTNDELFHLYKHVQQGNKNAINKLVAEHKKVINNPVMYEYMKQNKKGALHTMYLHLTRKKK